MTIEALVKAAVAEGIREALPALRDTIRAEMDTARARRLDDATADLLTPTDAAAVVGVSVKTVRRWVREGRLANRGAGRGIRLSRAELLAVKAGGAVPRNVIDMGSRVDELARRDRG